MDAKQIDRDAEVLMLRHVLEALWANTLANSGGDVLATTRRVAAESLAAIDGMYGTNGDPKPGRHEMLQAILHHEETFWKSVEWRVAQRLR